MRKDISMKDVRKGQMKFPATSGGVFSQEVCFFATSGGE